MSTLQAPSHEYRDYAELLDDYYARGWTDGLPVVPPTPELVTEFLAVAALEPDTVLGGVPTREVVVTAEHVAINAVMAGCRAEYMPVVVAAVRAHLSREGQLPQRHRHAVGRVAGRRHQRSGAGTPRRELHRRVLRPGVAGQRHDRSRPAAGDPQRLSCHSELPRPRDLLDAGALLVLLRRRRRGQPRGSP